MTTRKRKRSTKKEEVAQTFTIGQQFAFQYDQVYNVKRELDSVDVKRFHSDVQFLENVGFCHVLLNLKRVLQDSRHFLPPEPKPSMPKDIFSQMETRLTSEQYFDLGSLNIHIPNSGDYSYNVLTHYGGATNKSKTSTTTRLRQESNNWDAQHHIFSHAALLSGEQTRYEFCQYLAGKEPGKTLILLHDENEKNRYEWSTNCQIGLATSVTKEILETSWERIVFSSNILFQLATAQEFTDLQLDKLQTKIRWIFVQDRHLIPFERLQYICKLHVISTLSPHYSHPPTPTPTPTPVANNLKAVQFVSNTDRELNFLLGSRKSSSHQHSNLTLAFHLLIQMFHCHYHIHFQENPKPHETKKNQWTFRFLAGKQEKKWSSWVDNHPGIGFVRWQNWSEARASVTQIREIQLQSLNAEMNFIQQEHQTKENQLQKIQLMQTNHQEWVKRVMPAELDVNNVDSDYKDIFQELRLEFEVRRHPAVAVQAELDFYESKSVLLEVKRDMVTQQIRNLDTCNWFQNEEETMKNAQTCFCTVCKTSLVSKKRFALVMDCMHCFCWEHSHRSHFQNSSISCPSCRMAIADSVGGHHSESQRLLWIVSSRVLTIDGLLQMTLQDYGTRMYLLLEWVVHDLECIFKNNHKNNKSPLLTRLLIVCNMKYHRMGRILTYLLAQMHHHSLLKRLYQVEVKGVVALLNDPDPNLSTQFDAILVPDMRMETTKWKRDIFRQDLFRLFPDTPICYIDD